MDNFRLATAGQGTGDISQGPVYWINPDGTVTYKDASGTRNVGELIKEYDGGGFDATGLSGVGTLQGDMRSPEQTVTAGGGGGGEVDPDAAARASLLAEIQSRGGDVQSIYEQLFGSLDKLLKSRSGELEKQYGKQIEDVTSQYTGAIPDIESSYAALGAADSTDRGDAKDDAKEGFDSSISTIGENKKKDISALGQYGKESRVKFKTDKENAEKNINRAGSEQDVNALRGLRNDLEGNIDTARVTKATLGTDGEAAKSLSKLTGDNGRYESTVNALDGILKSSLAGAVKDAAVTAITNSAGLSDEEKKKVQQTYGNVYEEQQSL
jgi:hypothetical protein